MLIDCSARQGENDSQPAALQRRSGQGARQRGCDGNRRIERVIGSIRLASSAIISCTRALSRRTHRLKMALQMQPPSQQACTPSPRFLFQVGCHRRDATHTVSCYDNDCAASRWAGAACLVLSCLLLRRCRAADPPRPDVLEEKQQQQQQQPQPPRLPRSARRHPSR